MNLLFLFIGFVIGGVIAWIISSLQVKVKMIPKQDFDSITNQANDLRTQLELSKDRVNTLVQDKGDLQNNIKKQQDEISELNDRLRTNVVTISKLDAELNTSTQNLNALYEDLENLKKELKIKTDDYNELNKTVATLSANNQAMSEKLQTQKEEVEELRKQFNMEFENIASKILSDNSDKFTKLNQESLTGILKPLGENIDNFRKKVEEVYITEAKERFSLGEEVKKLQGLNSRLSEEATNLTNALLGNSKTQGDWGQMILENILEKSGLVLNREYFVQEYLKDIDGQYLTNEEGNRMQPDVIIAYPDNRKVIVDSKVSISAYTRYASCSNAIEQSGHLKEHLRSMRKHIDDLSRKSYQDYAETLDFVMMFVPNEPAYLLALQHDPDMWHYAYNKKILLISPTNLIAALKLIVDLWKREYQNQNALEIAKRGAALYDKLVNFVESFTTVGEQLKRAQNTYETAFGQLSKGHGNLIGQAEKLKELGVKAKKSLPQTLIEEATIE